MKALIHLVGYASTSRGALLTANEVFPAGDYVAPLARASHLLAHGRAEHVSLLEWEDECVVSRAEVTRRGLDKEPRHG